MINKEKCEPIEWHPAECADGVTLGCIDINVSNGNNHTRLVTRKCELPIALWWLHFRGNNCILLWFDLIQLDQWATYCRRLADLRFPCRINHLLDAAPQQETTHQRNESPPEGGAGKCFPMPTAKATRLIFFPPLMLLFLEPKRKVSRSETFDASDAISYVTWPIFVELTGIHSFDRPPFRPDHGRSHVVMERPKMADSGTMADRWAIGPNGRQTPRRRLYFHISGQTIFAAFYSWLPFRPWPSGGRKAKTTPTGNHCPVDAE